MSGQSSLPPAWLKFTHRFHHLSTRL